MPLLEVAAWRLYSCLLAMQAARLIKKCRLAAMQGKPPKTISEMLVFVKQENIDMTFVGPESYLSDGIVNIFQEEGLRILGPTKEAAILENSKCRAKDLLKSLNVPVPRCKNFDDPAAAREYVNQFCSENPDQGLVIKADGLAAGKGSVVCSTKDEALSTIERIMVRPKLFGQAGDRIEIEKRLEGRELMFFSLSDGRTVQPLESALDYKQAFSADETVAVRLFNKLSSNPNIENNPNTGGMGGFSPHPWMDEELTERIMNTIAVPTVRGFKEATGHEYVGVIYFGLRISEERWPSVLEINVRLGDPETQVILPRLETDFFHLSEAILDKKARLGATTVVQRLLLGICTVSGRAIKPLTSDGGRERPGYRGGHSHQYAHLGLEKIDPEVVVYHNGTAFCDDATGKRKLFTTGGGALTLVGRGKSLAEARIQGLRQYKEDPVQWNALQESQRPGLSMIIFGLEGRPGT